MGADFPHSPALQLTQYCRLEAIVTGTPSKIPVWKDKYNIPDKNVHNYDTMKQMVGNLNKKCTRKERLRRASFRSLYGLPAPVEVVQIN